MYKYKDEGWIKWKMKGMKRWIKEWIINKMKDVGDECMNIRMKDEQKERWRGWMDEWMNIRMKDK